MSSRPATRAERQLQTRERLIDAAAHVFARRGYHAATLEEVAHEAGYSTGAVYSNFSGKDDLFLAPADRQIARGSARAGGARGRAQVVAGAGSAAARAGAPGRREPALAGWFRSFIDENQEWPLLFYEFWSYGVRTERLRPEFEARRRAAREAIARPLLDAAASLGLEPRYPVEQLAAALSGRINGLGFERTVDPDAPSEDLAAFCVATPLTEGLGAPNR